MRTLIVDDHRFFRGTLRRLLEELSLAEVVGEAANGREAMDQVETSQPDLVLMDIQMPELDGLHAAETIKVRHPHIKVLLYSSFDAEVEAARQAAVADDVLGKQTLFRELVPMLERLGLANARSERQGVSPPRKEPTDPRTNADLEPDSEG